MASMPQRTLYSHLGIEILFEIKGLYNPSDNGKENGNYYILYWSYIIGILEKNMETTIELYRDNGKGKGNCYLGFRV